MNKQGKVWGNTSEIFNQNNVEIHRIEAKANGYCSIHKHQHKYNMFFVETGILMVEVWKNDYDLVDTTLLKAKEYTIVKPGEFHKFTAKTDVIAYEIYWTTLDSSDIIRKTSGGIENTFFERQNNENTTNI